MKAVIPFLFLCTSLFCSAQKTEPHFNSSQTLSFQENKGQVYDQDHKPRPDVLFSGKANGLNFHLLTNGVSYQLEKIVSWKKQKEFPGLKDHARENGEMPDQIMIYRVDINWLGCNSNCEMRTDKALVGCTNYYNGINHDGITGVKDFIGVTYKNIYKNIDLHYYSKNGSLKYDLIVAPYTNYKQIQLSIKGAQNITLQKDGSVIIETPLGEIKEEAPIVFQNGAQLKARWRLQKNTLSFEVENYDPSYSLIIDPIARLWGTYYGGNNDEYARSCDKDNSGNVYFGGDAYSNNAIATTGAHQVVLASGVDAYFVKFNAAGIRMWGTYYGGLGNDYGLSCHVDALGNGYLVGSSQSASNIATPGTHQTLNGGLEDAFVVKFNTNGIRSWGTYYGGTSWDYAYGCCTDQSGNVFITGVANSSNNISSSGSHQQVHGGGFFDSFLVKFNSSGVRQWGTFYGDIGGDYGNDVSTDALGNVFMVGETSTATGTVIATPGSYQTTLVGSNDGYLVKFDPSGIRQWGTYYGGNGADPVNAIELDASGNIYLTGSTTSTNGISTAGSHQALFGGARDGYIAKFNSTGFLSWGTYYGGAGIDDLYSIDLDNANNIYVGGTTASNTGTSIATAGSYQDVFGGGGTDAYLVQLNNGGVRQWATYYGGVGADQGHGVSYSSVNNQIYLVGYTGSSSGTVIATTNSHQSLIGSIGYTDAFCAAFVDCANFSVSIVSNPSVACTSASITLYGIGATSYTWSNNTYSNSVSLTPTANVNYTVVGELAACSATAQASISLTLYNSPTVTASSGTICLGQSFTINPTGASTYVYSGGNAVVTPNANSVYTVVGTDVNGCVNTTTMNVTVNPNPTITVSGGTICPGSSFTINPGGASTYTFSSGQVVTPSVTSNYTVIGTGTNGCVNYTGAVVAVTVVPGPTLTANFGGICIGQLFTIIPSGAQTYTIQGGQTIVTPTITTTYSIIGTSSLGCVSQTPVFSTVLVNSLPNVSISGITLICSGKNTTLTAIGATSYTWSTSSNATSIIVSPTSNTNYSVTGTDITTGCKNSAVLSVSVNPSPVISATGTLMCQGQSFTIMPTGASTYTYFPSGPVVSPTVNTTYSVVGTNNGCNSNTLNVFVNLYPAVNITITPNTGTICAGNTITLIASGANSYTWSTLAITPSITPTPLSNSVYSVSGQDANNCLGTHSVLVTVNPIPTLSINGTATLCAAQAATLFASGANTYTWFAGPQTASFAIAPMVSTNYSLTATSALGCTSSATYSVAVFAYPNVTVNVSSTTVCGGKTATLNAGTANSYSWSNGASTAATTVTPFVTTVYTLNAENAPGCYVTKTITIFVIVSPTVNVSSTQNPMCMGQTATITATGATTYSWNNFSFNNYIATSPTVNTTYTATGTHPNGCWHSVAFTQSIVSCTGINELRKQGSIYLYPNPSNGMFYIAGNTERRSMEIQIFDLEGRLVYKQENTNEEIKISLNEYSNGLYLVKIKCGDELLNNKIIIDR